MEYFDCLDESGNKTGEKVQREIAHALGISHGASHVFIYRLVNGQVELLLQKRADNKDSYPAMLDISTAGHVESGMDYLTTALKEAKEELGLVISPYQLKEVFVYHFHNEAFFNGKPFINDEFAQVYLYDGFKLDTDKLVLQKEEVSGVYWYSLKMIKEMLETGSNLTCLAKEEIEKIEEAINAQI